MKEVLGIAGARKSKFDATFYWYNNGKSEGILSCHIDDFVWGSINNFIKTVIKTLKKTFSISPEECETFKHLGLYVQQNDGEIIVHKVQYINELKEYQIEKPCKKIPDAHLTETEAQQLCMLAGQFNWTS